MWRPDQQGSVGAVLRWVAECFPERVAVIDADGSRTTYRDLLAYGGRLANAFLGRGLSPGDRVAAWMDDGAAYVELYVACALAGLVVIPLNTRYTVHEVRHVVEDSEPRAVVWDSGKDGAIEELASAGVLGDAVRVRRAGDGSRALEASDWDDLVALGSVHVDLEVAPHQLLVIGYTSGTTGRPKGALLTHASVRAVMRQNAAAYRLPFHSTIAMTGSMSFVSVVPAHVLTHLAVAGTLVFLGHWDVPSLLDKVERHQATFTYLPSPVVGEFVSHAARDLRRWQSLHSVLHSASKVSADALAALADVIGSRLVEGWGLTENSGGLVTATTAADIASRRLDPAILGTVGRPLPGYEVRAAVDDELLLRGPGLVSGYWRQPEASARAFRDGWFASGDVGTVDDHRYVTLLERRTDLIVSGGMNVYPAEVEAVIAAVPGVAECAVVGVPHSRWGQTVVAMVVPHAGADPEVTTIIERCRDRLAGYKKPTEIIFASSLPRTVSLKVSRAAVREAVARHRG